MVIVAAASAPKAAAAQMLVEGIVAVVNEDIILFSKLQERAAPIVQESARKSLSQELTPAQQNKIYRRALTEMINEVLISEQASKMRVRISSAEIDRAVNNMAKMNNLTVQQFMTALAKQGIGVKRYRQELRSQLLRFKVVQAKLQGRVRVTDREIEQFYNEQVRQARSGDRARVAHILVKVGQDADASTIAQKRRRAAAILERADAGAPFSALAKRYSEDDGTKARGGSLGWIDVADLPDEFNDVVLGLNGGEAGGPVRTSQGFHVVKVLEWEASDVRPLEEVRAEIEDRLFREQMAQQERLWLADLRRRAYIDVRLQP